MQNTTPENYLVEKNQPHESGLKIHVHAKNNLPEATSEYP